MSHPGQCPHCDAKIFVARGDKTKMRTSIIVVHKSGVVETNCPSCKKPILLPMEADLGQPLRKSLHTRFGVPLDMSKKSHS